MEEPSGAQRAVEDAEKSDCQLTLGSYQRIKMYNTFQVINYKYEDALSFTYIPTQLKNRNLFETLPFIYEPKMWTEQSRDHSRPLVLVIKTSIYQALFFPYKNKRQVSCSGPLVLVPHQSSDKFLCELVGA